jgi:hypothetical protein
MLISVTNVNTKVRLEDKNKEKTKIQERNLRWMPDRVDVHKGYSQKVTGGL